MKSSTKKSIGRALGIVILLTSIITFTMIGQQKVVIGILLFYMYCSHVVLADVMRRNTTKMCRYMYGRGEKKQQRRTIAYYGSRVAHLMKENNELYHENKELRKELAQ
jgi:5-bromo-4-chloroindolyl phosphate hydrolysis protein